MNAFNLNIVILTTFILLSQLREFAKIKHYDYLDKLIHKNSEHIAALAAQMQITTQRVSELTIKTDKLLQR